MTQIPISNSKCKSKGEEQFKIINYPGTYYPGCLPGSYASSYARWGQQSWPGNLHLL